MKNDKSTWQRIKSTQNDMVTHFLTLKGEKVINTVSLLILLLICAIFWFIFIWFSHLWLPHKFFTIVHLWRLRLSSKEFSRSLENADFPRKATYSYLIITQNQIASSNVHGLKQVKIAAKLLLIKRQCHVSFFFVQINQIIAKKIAIYAE